MTINQIPWNIFNDPVQEWHVMPTYFVIEYCFYAMMIISLAHAMKNGENHILVWFSSLFTGTLYCTFVMVLQFTNNVWQAQATIMITPRFPLYVCSVYNVFLYLSMVSSWRLGFENPIPESAVTGLLSVLIYFPYDMIGVKHLWWTWHITDPWIRNRIMSTPIANSTWILTFSVSFSLVLYLCRGKMKFKSLTTVIVCGILTAPITFAMVTILQLLSLEQLWVPSIWSYILAISIVTTIIIISSVLLIDTRKSYKWIEHKCLTKLDPFLGACVLVYFGILFILGYNGRPETFNSTGIHQVIGPCNETILDFKNLNSDRCVCPNNIPDEWDMCGENFPSGHITVEWYKICGTAHKNVTHWNNVLAIICSVAAFMFSILIIYLPIRSHRKPKIKER